MIPALSLVHLILTPFAAASFRGGRNLAEAASMIVPLGYLMGGWYALGGPTPDPRNTLRMDSRTAEERCATSETLSVRIHRMRRGEVWTRLLVDKITTMPKQELGARIGSIVARRVRVIFGPRTGRLARRCAAIGAQTRVDAKRGDSGFSGV